MAEYTITAADGKRYIVEAPQGLPPDLVRDDLNRQLRRQQIRSRVAEPAPVERTVMGQIGEGLRGIPRGAISLGETAAIGASALLPDEEESYLREIISGAAERAASPFQRKPGYEDSMAGTFGEVAGSFLPLMATGALGLAGRAAATGLAGAAGAGTARTRAEQGGATPEERAKATALGTAVGLSEVLVPFRILDNALDATAATTIFNRIKRAGITGGAEGAQEAAAEVAQNLIEKGLYDPEQGVFVGTGESFGYGAGVGGLVQGLFDLFVKDRSAAGAPPPAPTEEEQAPEVPPAPPSIEGGLFGGQELATVFDSDIIEEIGLDLGKSTANKLFGLDLADRAQRAEAEAILTSYINNPLVRRNKPEVISRIRPILDSPIFRRKTEDEDFAPIGTIAAPEEEIPLEERIRVRSPADVQSDFIDIDETRQIQDLLDEEELARMQQEEDARLAAQEAARADAERTRTVEEIATLDARREAARAAESDEKRRQILLPIIESGRIADPANLARAFSAELRRQGFANTTPTETELATIERAVGVQQAVTTAETERAAADAALQARQEAEQRAGVAPLESLIPERRTVPPAAPVVVSPQEQERAEKARLNRERLDRTGRGLEGQLEIPVIPRAKGAPAAQAAAQEAPAADQGAAPQQMAFDFDAALDEAGVPKAAPVRKRVKNKSPAQAKAELTAFAANPVVKPEVAAAVTKLADSIPVEAAPAAQVPEVPVETAPAAVEEAAPIPTASVETAPVPKEEQAFRAKLTSAIESANQSKLAQIFQDVTGMAPTSDVRGQIAQFSLPEQVAIYNEYASSQGRSELTLPGRFLMKTGQPRTINVDGVERPTTNSNGQPIHPTEEGLRNFWRSFGSSKAVDDLGRPLVLYRGLNTVREEALNVEERKSYANFASDSPYVANSYANPDEPFDSGGPVLPLYINADKLIEFPVKVSDYDGVRRFDKFEFDRRAKALTPGEVLVARQVYDIGPRASLKADPERRYSYPSDIYAWNRGVSVKSAIGNEGAFSSEKPSIINAVQPKREEAASIPANQRIMQLVEQGATPAQILRAITQDKDLPQALRDMAAQMLRVAPNINVPVISRRFEAPDEVGEYVHPSKGDEAIYLDPRAESVAQTFVHEFIHAATVNGIARGVPAGRRLKEMFDAYKAATPEADTYGLTNVYEFVAEALTNPKFQVELKSRNLKGTKKSYWDSFVDFVKNILGIQQRGPLEEILDLTKDLAVQQDKVWQAAERALTDQTPAANVRFLNVQGAQLKKASTPVKAPRFKRAVAALFDKGQEAVTKTMIWGLGIDQINDYVQSYIKKKGPNYEPFAASFNRFTQITGKLEGEMRQFIDGITAQVARMGDWRNSHPDLYEDMNALVYGGTLDKVDLTKPKSTYVGNPDKLKAYDRLKKIYDKLEPSGGAAVYRQMRAIYNRVFNNISQQVYDRVYSETQDANLATTIKNKFTEQMKLSGLEGYAALTRNNGKYRIKYFLPKSDVPYFETFENSADWNARQKQLLEEDGVNPKDMQPFLHGDKSVFDGIVPTSFMGDLVQTLKNKGASDDVLQAVMELGISVSPAQVVMERLAKRKETPGYTVDAFAAFQESVVGLQRKLINMKYGAQMSKEVTDMRATRKNVPTDPNVDYFIGEAASRAEYAANPNQNLISNVLTTGTYGWTLGLNVSSAIVDMMSLMVTGGYLSGKFKSRRKAHAALVKAGRDILGMGTTADVETMVTQGLEGDALKEALATAGITERDVARRRVAPSMLNIDFNNPEQAKKYGYLRALVNKVQQQGHSERFSDLEERAEFGETNWISKIAARMGFMMSTSERFKRETGLKAYYDLALAEVAPNGDPTKATPEQMEKAANDAMEMSRLLNGGSTPVTGPGFQRDNFWRVAFMYRSFAFRQMYVQVKTLYDATMNDEKVVRDAARKFGSTVLLTSGALVGVQGMPLFGPVALLLNVLAQPFVDDEEEEKFVQNMLRSNLDPLIYEGLPNALLNMNVSERASLTDLLARDTNLPDDATFAETLAAHFGGPAFGSIERGLRGWRLIEQGQVQRGIESMVPTTLASILKSIRFATDGAAETLRGDDVIQISPVAVVSQFLGFTPADYARTMELKSVQAGIDRRVAERKSNLYAAAYAAYRVGDSAGLAQVMQKMIEFNQKFPAEAITSAGLRQSLRTRDRNSAAMLGGTLPRESRRSEWQEAADDWGVQFPE